MLYHIVQQTITIRTYTVLYYKKKNQTLIISKTNQQYFLIYIYFLFFQTLLTYDLYKYTLKIFNPKIKLYNVTMTKIDRNLCSKIIFFIIITHKVHSCNQNY